MSTSTMPRRTGWVPFCVLACCIICLCVACDHDAPVGATQPPAKVPLPSKERAETSEPDASGLTSRAGQSGARGSSDQASAASKAAAAEKRLVAQVRKKPIVTKHYDIEYWDYECEGLIVLTKSAGGLPGDKAEALAKAYLAKKGLDVKAMERDKRLVFDIYCPS